MLRSTFTTFAIFTCFIKAQPPNQLYKGCGVSIYKNQSCTDFTNRIYGGKIAGWFEIPWQVSITIRVGRHFDRCGGSLINEHYVLSAAHCFYVEDLSLNNITVYLGYLRLYKKNKFSEKNAVKKIIIHPKFNDETFFSDVALLQLTNKVTFTNSIRPVCLQSDSFNVKGIDAVVSGYGEYNGAQLNKRILRRGAVTVLSNTHKFCIDGAISNTVDSSELCAYNKEDDFCDGDSGGPLTTLINGTCTMIGIISNNEICGSPKEAGIYMRVLSFYEWISNNTKDNN